MGDQVGTHLSQMVPLVSHMGPIFNQRASVATSHQINSNNPKIHLKSIIYIKIT